MPILHVQRSILPPNGFLAAAKQDSVYVAASFNIGVLSGKAQQALPEDFQVLVIGSGGPAKTVYAWTGSAWVDLETFEEVASTSIMGIVHFRNPADYDVEFVW